MPGLPPWSTTNYPHAALDRQLTRRAAIGISLGLTGAGVAAAAAMAMPGISAGLVAAAETSGCEMHEQYPGLIGDDHWQGPTFGLDVSWDPIRWGIGDRSNPGVANAMGREDQPVDCGFGQGGSDRLTLANSMWESGVLVITSYDRLMWTPREMADAMTQPGWVQNLRLPAESPLLLAEATDDTLAAVAADAEDPGHTVYWQATFPEDDESVIHQFTLHMWESGAVYALHDLEGITIASIDPFAVLDLETVRQALDDWQG